MPLEERLNDIPRGNTAPGVNRAVIEYLLAAGEIKGPLLDVPCGGGIFLDAVKGFFPDVDTYGVDIEPREGTAHRMFKSDLSGSEPLDLGEKFGLITSISGVMEFDNTLNFFRRLRENIADDGLLIVTNDNLLSVRDRVLYFFSGRFRQYPMFVADDAPTWKILALQNLLRILKDAGFETAEVRYVPAKWTEWLWLPIALPIYLFQSMAFAFGRDAMPYEEKAARYPFASLLSRHYFIVCRPAGLPPENRQALKIRAPE